MKRLLVISLIAFAAFAAEGYKVINKIKIGGPGSWDYSYVDTANHRLYVLENPAADPTCSRN